MQPHDVAMDIVVEGRKVGILILPSLSILARFELARGILIPIGFISIILALFAFVVAIQLMRRFVNPLADVIYAARAMAGGNLRTRIPSTGPQDLRSLSENFNEMAASLERYDRERRGMLADVAHELRTPLSIVRGRLEGIVDGIYTQDGSQVSLALEQVYVLERLVEDLRLLTLAETRQLTFDKTRVDVGVLLQRTLEMFSAEAGEKNISLSFEERDGDLALIGDPQRLEQVFGNLVGNAIRYVPEGGRVWVAAAADPQALRVTISDNGAGIPQEDLPFIFDRFWRKEKSRSRLNGGTGLGLAIAKQLVEAQGGSIQARNLPEGGLQVEIRLERKASP
jgi:two-component system OmpR family sensor kinase/two-component system sensor histidine kinase BaeS